MCSLSLDKSFFLYICGCDPESVGQVCEWKGFRSRRGTGSPASHILHIIGSFAGHEYEAGFDSFFHPAGLFSMACDRDSDSNWIACDGKVFQVS